MTIKNKNKIKNEKKQFIVKRLFNLKSFNKLLVCLIIILGVSYMACMNDLAIKGFILQDLKSKSKKLTSDNNNTELEIMKLQAYENIDAKAKEMKMVQVDKIDYINVLSSIVAKK
jgi:hypothetical protein